jgi:hypothetical protein
MARDRTWYRRDFFKLQVLLNVLYQFMPCVNFNAVAQWLSPPFDTRLKTKQSRVRIRLPPQSPEWGQEI